MKEITKFLEQEVKSLKNKSYDTPTHLDLCFEILDAVMKAEQEDVMNFPLYLIFSHVCRSP